MSEYKLTQGIIHLSESKLWDRAKLEWSIYTIHYEEEPDTCLCGHSPINEICIIKNSSNGNYATVGNCCVKKFLNLESEKLFRSIRAIRKDITKSVNTETAAYARQNNWISEWEHGFYTSIYKKRKLSEKQSAIKTDINLKILKNIKNSRMR